MSGNVTEHKNPKQTLIFVKEKANIKGWIDIRVINATITSQKIMAKYGKCIPNH